MKFTPNEHFWNEEKTYRLKYTCEACAFFDRPTGQCAHGWPNAEHREEWYRGRPDWIVFCKEFELD